MSDSDDDVPLAKRAAPAEPAAPEPKADAANGPASEKRKADDDSDSSDDDVPLAQRKPVAKPTAKAKPAPKKAKPAPKPAPKKRKKEEEEEEEDGESSSSSSDDSSSDGELSNSDDDEPVKKKKPSKKPAAKKKKQPARGAAPRAGARKKDGEVKWTTLEHQGVLFPEDYTPHGIKMKYDGNEVDLTPEQEEVATMFALMRDTEYVSKPTFVKNFWEAFSKVLGKGHTVKKLELCDFTAIYEHFMAEREKKKQMTKEEKLAIKNARMAEEASFKVAYVDGKVEQVGNFRVEPPGLFRGRGEHPRMGKLKTRIYPEDITLNLGEDAPIPECPMPGHQWGEIRHDHTVTWLAFWKDPMDQKQFKYVWLAANSGFKADSDKEKYEKARNLGNHIEAIRQDYTSKFNSQDRIVQQMAVATYLIDKLALRAGHDKDDDEADTVGCCSLKVENVMLEPPCSLKFDFLGKDSIRYENTTEVLPEVYKNVELFRRVDQHGKRKNDGDEIFEFNVSILNNHLKSLMPGLSAKVFRTYNASVTLDTLLHENVDPNMTIDEKIAEYNRANKEVAVLCNHQRAVPKQHDNQMEKLNTKLNAIREELHALKKEMKEKTDKADKAKWEGKVEKKQAQLDKAEIQAKVKDELKTVALGTSKINYMDPRITVAWAKRMDVPIEKVFNRSLLSKFFWTMSCEPEFRF